MRVVRVLNDTSHVKVLDGDAVTSPLRDVTLTMTSEGDTVTSPLSDATPTMASEEDAVMLLSRDVTPAIALRGMPRRHHQITSPVSGIGPGDCDAAIK